ncbi:MAG TPA: serine/threonine-protein kinase [Ignavibacteria bacterium]
MDYLAEGKYKIQSKISEGGMGTIFLGLHAKLDRLVAIKRLHSDLTSNELFRDRFIEEAKILAHLNHPNIISIYDLIEENESYYIVMEYIEGETLEKILDKSSIGLHPDRATAIFKKILSAFDYAHKKGVIHRDIKPSNVIVQNDDNPKILDFGIAKLIQSKSKITKAGTLMGTLYYMSPEQILGLNVDSRSDIYSLGVLFYEMLTNHIPYGNEKNNEYEMMNSIISNEIIDIRNYKQNLNDNIINAINKALSKDIEYRFDTCENFSKALEYGYEPGNTINTNKKTRDFLNYNNVNVHNGKNKTQIKNIQQHNKNKILITLLSTFFIVIIAVLVYILAKSEDIPIVKKVLSEKNFKEDNPVIKDTQNKQTSEIMADEADVKRTVYEIISAWENKNADKFFSYLTNDYTYMSKDGLHRTFSERKNKAYEIFAVNDYINISISNLSVRVNGNDADAEYYQIYHSTKLNENTTKHLYFRKMGNKWKVYKELSGFN